MSIDWVAVFTTDPATFVALLPQQSPWPLLLGQTLAVSSQPKVAIATVIQTWLKTPKLWPLCRQLTETLSQHCPAPYPSYAEVIQLWQTAYRELSGDEGLRLRELFFEIYPQDLDNLTYLFDSAVKAQDVLRLSLYYEALREHYEQERTLPKLTLLTFGYLYANGLPDLLLDFLELYARYQKDADQQKAIRLIQAALAGSETVPELYRDSVDVGLRGLVGIFFHRYWVYPALSLLTTTLITTLETVEISAAESRLLTAKLLVEICDLSQDCGETERVEHYLPQLQTALRLNSQFGATLDEFAASLGMVPSALGNMLQRLVGMLNYQTDNLALVRWLQTIISPMYRTETGQATTVPPTQHVLSRRIRLGFVSQYWGVHPIGILTEPMLKRLNQHLFESYLYRDAKQVDGDYLTEYLATLPDHYRSLVNASVESVAQTIQTDQLDVLVGMDSIETAKGMAVLRRQAAPYQISWLGGDSPATPEIQGMVGDFYLISEAMQTLYHEEPLLCGSYMAVQGFAATPLKVAAFRSWLKVADDAVILWTNAVGRKRSLASIRAQVEILAAVPNAVLIVKGWCYAAKVAALYRQIAEPLGAAERLRFIEITHTVEEHRGQLAAVDLVLDTFPYTGATTTMEALYFNTPVLTKVGQHYYGRMSYSLLHNCDLADCIAFTVEDYVTQGIALASNPGVLRTLKAQLQTSKFWSICFEPRLNMRSLEREICRVLGRSDYCQLDQELAAAQGAAGAGFLALWATLQGAQPALKQHALEAELAQLRECVHHDPTDAAAKLNQLYLWLALDDKAMAVERAQQWFEAMLQAPSEPIEAASLYDPVFQGLSGTFTVQQLLGYWLSVYSSYVFNAAAIRYSRLVQQLGASIPENTLAVAVMALQQGLPEGHWWLQQVAAIPELEAQVIAAQMIANQAAAVSLPYCGYRLSLEPSWASICTLVLVAQGRWFEAEIEFVQQVVRPGMTVLDVGANVGVYTFAIASHLRNQGQVHAFEPTAKCQALIQQTIASNDLASLVKLHPVAVGATMGNVSLQSQAASELNAVSQTAGDIRQITLDSLNLEAADLIKIDTEGMEVAVLQGAQQLLQQRKPILIIENMNGAQVTGEQTMTYLEPLGYRFYRYNPYQQCLIKLRQSDLANTLNLIGVHPEAPRGLWLPHV